MKLKLLLNFCLLAWGSVYAQNTTDKTNITGTYTLVLVDNIKANGSRVHLYGDRPQGILVLDTAGHYVLEIVSEGRPKFVSGDKSKGTDEENHLAIQGCNAHFGRYMIDNMNHTITFLIDHASFPNWENTKQVRPFDFDGKVLKYSVPSPTSGGAVTGEVVWKKE